MKRLVNFRYSVAVPVSLALGVAACIMFANLRVLGGILLFSAIPVIGFAVGIIKKSLRYKAVVTALVCMLVSALGFLLMQAKIDKLAPSEVSGSAVIDARYTGESRVESLYVYSFDDAVFTVNGRVFSNQRISVYSYSPRSFSFGETVRFYGSVRSNPFREDDGSLNTYLLTSGVSFSVNTDFSELERTGNRLNLFERVRVRLEQTVKGAMDKDNASVVIGMMFGDTSEMNAHVISGMRYAGIAHIFAVSGLHVGFVSALAIALLRLFKVRRWPRCIASILITFFYCAICGFSASSVRALIMFALLSISSAAGVKYDALGSIFLSFGAILLIKPQSIVDYGFILSYSAVIAIVVFSRAISRVLYFLPSPVRGGVSVTLAAQLGTVPASLSFFGYMSAISTVINVFMLPVVSVYFMFTASCVILSAVFSAPWMLAGSNFLTGLLVDFVSLVDFSKFVVPGYATVGMVAVYFFGLIASSDIVNLPFKVKLPLFFVIVAACIVLSQLFVSGVL
ncbi:MAG: ComEC/Rec2 family competence protein [Clostridia bacterium]|nr:ComEC/Rec2 family competence protein [Clostridia bacterium]